MSDIRNIKTTADNWLAISQDLKWPLTGFTRTLNHMAICSTTCVSWHSQLRPGGFCWSEWTFTVYMLSLVETEAFRLESRCYGVLLNDLTCTIHIPCGGGLIIFCRLICHIYINGHWQEKQGRYRSLRYIFYGVSLASVSCRRRWPPPTTLALTMILG